ncbi:CocE/NonD family hydrolase [Limobrevibacterium gyesilva]|uniref:CocE/NonD family hydrolase n=1 Tax=Limobrevibacterium gyesilva TaxID=2991712 RepID=A0AA42CIB8_9PROT|nr:CocE/NonD family hydrolase [Limobrevibacterium gyesilva]MCW3475772.1 CocE/NonD family hydrolase [Limobrevibacterium gyesilva]
MTDETEAAGAWRVTPHAYAERRPPTFPASPPASCYVTMRDGVRLAVDVHLPEGAGPVPAILILTPYYRRFRLALGAPPDTEAAPGAAKFRDLFVPRGYALVVVDVRGTGASFGTRDSFRSPRERDDHAEIADWVVRQPWSNGAIGATGISYVGAAADFLASTGHPAVRAIAPLFSVWDTWSNHYYPGGLLLNRLAETYDALMVGLDHDRRDLLAATAYFGNPHFQGPMPVDGDNGAMAQQAVAEHLGNFRMVDFIREFPCRDDALPYNPGFTGTSFSPFAYAANLRSDVAVYCVSGWMDGAGFSNGAISRFLSLPNPNKHLLLGPWDHGARSNVSPWRRTVVPEFPWTTEILRFFDHYLMGHDTGLQHESPVHSYTIGAESWHEAQSWPPQVAPTVMPLDGGTYQADFAIGTGANTRYGRLAAFDVRDYYADWHGRDAKMLCSTGEKLARDTVLTGHPVLTLHLSCSEPDAAIHAYLEDVAPDGTCRYVTEGMLRALHRQESAAPALHQVVGPRHSFARADAKPLVPGEVTELRVALLPTSWMFRAGHRIRVAIAAADSDNFGQVPHGRPPVLTIAGGRSRIELPLTR